MLFAKATCQAQGIPYFAGIIGETSDFSLMSGLKFCIAFYISMTLRRREFIIKDNVGICYF
jgi:hypothetical protein